MKTISILGCGWLGMPLGVELLKFGNKVLGSSRSKEKLAEIESNGMEPFLVNLDSANNLPIAFFESEIIILNIPPSNAQSEQLYVGQLERFLAILSSETHVIFISSTGVYPNLNREVTEKDAILESKSRSGISLLQAEQKFHSSKHTVIRFGGLIDQRRHPGKWFAGKTGLSGGNERVNMIHLDDCIGAIWSIIEGNHWGEVFNVCSQEHPMKADYYTMMSKKIGREPPRFSSQDTSKWKLVSSEKFLKFTSYSFRREIDEI